MGMFAKVVESEIAASPMAPRNDNFEACAETIVEIWDGKAKVH